MTIASLILSVILALALLCLLYWAARMAPALLTSLTKLGHDSDSLHQQVFPVLGFLGVLAILLKLTLF